MDAAGGEMGGFTTRDYTCYSATVLDDYRTYALDLLGDILVNSNFAASSIEKEKMSILREISTSRDIPYERVHSLLKSTVWPDHPLGCAIAGEPEDLKSIERSDSNCGGKCGSPGFCGDRLRCILAVVGKR
jgi:predicted Zn-dependent peptidase